MGYMKVLYNIKVKFNSTICNVILLVHNFWLRKQSKNTKIGYISIRSMLSILRFIKSTKLIYMC